MSAKIDPSKVVSLKSLTRVHESLFRWLLNSFLFPSLTVLVLSGMGGCVSPPELNHLCLGEGSCWLGPVAALILYITAESWTNSFCLKIVTLHGMEKVKGGCTSAFS